MNKIYTLSLLILALLAGSASAASLHGSRARLAAHDCTGFITATSSESDDIQAIEKKDAQDLIVADAYGLQPMHRAGKYCKPDVIDALVRRGVDVNVLTPSGQSPLMLAIDTDPRERSRVSSGQWPSTIATLISHDAHVDVPVKGRNKKPMSVRTYLVVHDWDHLLTEGLQWKEDYCRPVIHTLITEIHIPKVLASLTASYLSEQDRALLKEQQQNRCVIS